MTYPFVLTLCIVLATTANAFSRIKLTNSVRSFQTMALHLSDSDATPTTEVVTDATTIDTTAEATTAVATESNDNELDIDLDQLAEESASSAFKPKADLSSLYVADETRKAPRQAQWFPMLLSPPALDGAMAGDVGFDPIGFSKDKESLNRMREAEIKHSRLAMLAAAGWPLSELWHNEIADAFGLDSILTETGRAPSILNGGLSNEWIIGAAVVSAIVGGLLEFKTFSAQTKEGYKPGELDFDPLNLYTFRASFGLDQITEKITREEKLARARQDMELCEIKHGRLSMLAITAFAAQEYLSGIPVVQQTPFFFGDPII